MPHFFFCFRCKKPQMLPSCPPPQTHAQKGKRSLSSFGGDLFSSLEFFKNSQIFKELCHFFNLSGGRSSCLFGLQLPPLPRAFRGEWLVTPTTSWLLLGATARLCTRQVSRLCPRSEAEGGAATRPPKQPPALRGIPRVTREPFWLQSPHHSRLWAHHLGSYSSPSDSRDPSEDWLALRLIFPSSHKIKQDTAFHHTHFSLINRTQWPTSWGLISEEARFQTLVTQRACLPFSVVM